MNLIDLHCDTAAKILDSKTGEGLRENSFDIDLKGMKKAGTLAQFFACFVHLELFQGEDKFEQAYQYARKMLARMKEEVALNADDIAFAYSYEELMRNKEANKISVISTVEEGGIINGDMAKLEELYREGIRLITLTWNFENCMGFPNSKDPEIMSKGLKPFGIEAVERMNELGMLVDVSHMSDGGFYDVIKYSKAPVVASHSNARAICGHTRNMTDEMLKMLAEKGGVTGINFYPAFVNEKEVAMKEDLIRQIRHIVNVAGIDVVAIGTDFDGFYPGDLEINHVSKMDILYDALLKDGFTSSEVDKIWSGNALRVIKDVLK